MISDDSSTKFIGAAKAGRLCAVVTQAQLVPGQ